MTAAKTRSGTVPAKGKPARSAPAKAATKRAPPAPAKAGKSKPAPVAGNKAPAAKAAATPSARPVAKAAPAKVVPAKVAAAKPVPAPARNAPIAAVPAKTAPPKTAPAKAPVKNAKSVTVKSASPGRKGRGDGGSEANLHKRVDSERIAQHIAAFEKSGGRVEKLGVTRVLQKVSEVAATAPAQASKTGGRRR